jgi:Zn-dependent protease with chaperone function
MSISSIISLCRCLLLSACFVFPLNAYSQTASPLADIPNPAGRIHITNSDEFSFRLDCSLIAPDMAQPNTLWVRISDMTADKDEQKARFARLNVPVCKVVAGAFNVSSNHPERINTLEFILFDGSEKKAYFNEIDSSGNPRRHVVIYTPLLDPAVPPFELLFSIAHELGHAAYNHPSKNKSFALSERLKGIVGTLVFAIAGIIMYSKMRKNKIAQLGSAILILEAIVFLLISYKHSNTLPEKNEIAADAFGIKVMQQLGDSRDATIAEVIRIMERHDPSEKIGRGWWGGQNSHPGTKERKEAMLKLQSQKAQ